MAATAAHAQSTDSGRIPIGQNPPRGNSGNVSEPVITTGNTCTSSSQCPAGTRCFPSPGGGPGVCGISASDRAVIKQVQDYNQSQAAPDQPDLWKFGSDGLFDAFQLGIAKGLCASCLGIVTTDSNGNLSSDNGVLGQLSLLIGGMYANQPASTSTYVADVMDSLNIGLAQPAYAQGIGFSVLTPILDIWKIFRNIAYLFFIIVMVAIGFMIMFRQKVGQTAVTAQQAIPSVIIALVTVTFSYAIAGLLIDLMFLVMFGMGALFGATDLVNRSALQLGSYILFKSDIVGQGANAIGSFVESTIGLGIVGDGIGLFAGLTGGLIIVIVIIFNVFRLFFNLLRIYLEIILTIVFAPIMLMIGAVPGQNAFATWLRNLFANLAVFPAILGLLIVFDFIVVSTRDSNGGGFVPPYLVGSGTASVVPLLAGLALIFALPEFVTQVKKSLGATESAFAGLLRAGGGRFAKGADLGIALGGVAGGGAIGLTRGILANRRAGVSPLRDPEPYFRGLLKKEISDSAGTKTVGFLPSAQRGLSIGQSARRYIDDIKDERFLDANNIFKVIRELQLKEKGGSSGSSGGGSGGTSSGQGS